MAWSSWHLRRDLSPRGTSMLAMLTFEMLHQHRDPDSERTARADGASTSASQDERLDRMEASLQTYGQALQCLT